MVDVQRDKPEPPIVVTLTKDEAQSFLDWGYREIHVNRKSVALEIYNGLKKLGFIPYAD